MKTIIQSQNAKLICRIALLIPVRRSFDYLLPDDLTVHTNLVGCRVIVPFGKQTKIGVMTDIDVNSEIAPSKLKPIQELVDHTPLFNKTDMQLLSWVASYYHHPIGDVLNAALPGLLRKNRAASLPRQTVLRLTTQGMSISLDTFKHATRQAVLMTALKNSPQHQLSTLELSKQKITWQQPATSLINKGLVERIQCDINVSSQQRSVAAPLHLTHAQRIAVDAVSEQLSGFEVFLLDGVTGSGKTEVYMQLIQHVLRQGKQALVLLPEIALTPQLEQRFLSRFKEKIAVYHSGLTEKARFQNWLEFRNGIASILLGTRSASFIPMSKPGLIIIDEEHDPSFKQQEGFRFSARNVAIRRAQLLDIPIVLGSATPSIETFHNATRNRYRHLKLPARTGNIDLPEIQLLDIRNQTIHAGLSNPLIKLIETTLNNHQQIIIFINRRGYAPALTCHQCGWVARCSRCETNTVVHHGQQRLLCHHCGAVNLLPKHCPACHSTDLVSLGIGTERVEKFLQQQFPDYNTARFDRDNIPNKATLDTMLEAVKSRQIDILIGTQMLAKGHHFPGVTVVAVLDTDQGLFSSDFRASERLAQLIIQVAGRAGREQKGRVVLQTRQPDHPLLAMLIKQDYPKFAQQALQERFSAKLPPASHHALFRVRATTQELPNAVLQMIRNELETYTDEILILGPVPSPMEKKAGQYRYQLLVQASQRKPLHNCLDKIIPFIENLKLAKRVRWSVDVDPIDLF
ncbi:MAG: primosomal protein N' [Gammaproteobacteria bacterium]|nr:primosomal protein N' [Gammaproteobacteria bacterium]